MKRIILLLALSAVSFTGIAEDSENYIYNGSARCQVMNSDKGTLTVNELAIKYGYKIINSGSGYATLLKDGRYYTVSKVMVNRAGLVTFVRVERLK